MSTTAPYEPFTLGDIRCTESMDLWIGRYVDDLLLANIASNK